MFRALRASLSALIVAALLATSGLILSGSATAATRLVTTADVNVRTGPGTFFQVVATLKKGSQVIQAASPSKGWTAITYAGKKRYVSSSYLKAAPVTGAPDPSTAPKTTAAWTTARLNVRTGPGSTYAKITVLDKGAEVGTTGRTSKGFSEIWLSSKRRWVSSAYLTRTKPKQPLPAVVGQATTTRSLVVRDAGTKTYKRLGSVPSGTVVNLTGGETRYAAQIIWNKRLAWVNRAYLKTKTAEPQPETDLPTTTVMYATTTLNIRSSSADDYTLITEVPRGTKLDVTSTVVNDRRQIVYQGSLRWVNNLYLSLTAPAPQTSTFVCTGCTKLTPNAKLVLAATRANFPEIVRIGGVRADALPDHPSGRALDLMITKYKSNNAYGWTVAKYMRAHADELNIQYVIFDRHIWNIARDKEGWRLMGDRGGDTANHRDHVHVTVQK